LLGTDGQKMSKSRNNAIAIAATADETARLIRGAKTDTKRHITYEPASRPEISNLVLLTALCQDTDPERIAEDIGARGAAELKRRATEAINERLRPIRTARAQLIADRTYLRQVILDGSAAAAAIADQTLNAVSTAMHTAY
jgi:tryptophanyl-tRNA synthetase